MPDAGKLGAALELLAAFAALAAAALCFLLGWLTVDAAAVLTLLFLVALAGLAWRRFDGGRHPCFFFLCMLTLFQGGRLLAYCLGGDTEMFRISLLTPFAFDVSREVAGRSLAAIAVSGVCIYAPCRWNYRRSSPIAVRSYAAFLPYLYLLFSLSVPLQLYKNYGYYQYARDHGGYLVVFTDHGGMAASIPLAVRVVSLITLPAFVGIFVLERRKRVLRYVAAVYFAMAAPILLLGSRGGVFSLVLALWYLAKMKSGGRTRLYSAALLAAVLVLAGSLIGWFRAGTLEAGALEGPSLFVAGQGVSLNVTEVAIAYRGHFARHIAANLADELRSAFSPTDHRAYVAGKNFDADVSMFLNPIAYEMGSGGGSSYVAEAYVAGGLAGVAIVSVLVGGLLHGMQLSASHPPGLFLVGLILPDVLLMPRGGLVDWVSALLLRIGILVPGLLAGWYVYRAGRQIVGVLVNSSSSNNSDSGLAPPRPENRRGNNRGNR